MRPTPNRRVALLFVALLGLAVTACAPRSGTRPPTYSTTATRLLELVNTQRAQGAVCGSNSMPPAPRLQLEARLVRAAQEHSADQAAHRTMSHVGSDGSTVGSRVTAAGYSWSLVAENVAWNYDSPETVMVGWMSSVPHCLAIMHPAVSEFGAAEVDRYWTQVFADPR
ncbi:MAG TPA: CAP domain-containing protein [Trueperaceae bacterium]|nr:CAP domain-containing protein [Trueperaceae bacterium]